MAMGWVTLLEGNDNVAALVKSSVGYDSRGGEQMEAAKQRRQLDRDLWIVAGTALAASFTMIFFVFRTQGLVANAGDPYEYGKIAHGFVEHGFTELTRRSAMLY